MKHKTLKDPSAILLAELNAQDKQFFNVNAARQILSSSDPRAVIELLRQMVSRGLLMRIKDGLYHIIPYDKAPDTYQPDWHITASHIIENSDYYIGYYSALSIHSLITQPALNEQIVVNKRPSKKIIEVKNISFQIIYHNSDHFFGSKSTWIDNFNKVKCSDLEKTFIDCLFMPEYAGGTSEIAKALHKAHANINFIKLYDYAIKFKNQAVVKRLGFLLELLDIKSDIISKLLEYRTEAFTLLDPSLPKEGKMISRWRIQQNIDSETILTSLGN